MSDSKFFKAFKSNMDAVGLPAPASLFGTLTVALGTTSAIASAISKLGPSVSLYMVVRTIPVAAGATALAAGISELATAVGALAASFYLGACIGSLIAAAIDTYGTAVVGTLSVWARKMSKHLKMPSGAFMLLAVMTYPELSPIRGAIDRARQLDGRNAYA
ncbi:MAG TPA: hypothetical protein VJV79_11330 [Polyangiaceae bacterium]|nr:hypothetical protein [Polyangiaceae bacterium]